MVTVTTAWGGADHAEDSLLCAEMNAALRGAARVEAVVIDHAPGVVDVEVRLPDLAPALVESRRSWVEIKLSALVAGAFEAEGLSLGRVVVV